MIHSTLAKEKDKKRTIIGHASISSVFLPVRSYANFCGTDGGYMG